MILEVLNKQGDTVQDTVAVLESFRQYCNDLYKAQTIRDEGSMEDYLAHKAMKWLTNEHRERLMAPLQPGKICVALQEMPSAKAPGTDGLTVAFYRAYQDLLIPQLVTLFEEVAENG
ncbi:hypothetical protein NDU88_004891 [Pleurodeles waltl]|uniref:Reverse transcriptase n=1 Tax=Pleurodeles waltl TaxID=8319 RepID=A0AAV7QJI2_PLEWA|nr:hypothetical protein NDU88_004891 [Pleurodeles waltl]